MDKDSSTIREILSLVKIYMLFKLKAYTAFSDWKFAIYWVVEGLEIAMDKDSSTIREILSLVKIYMLLFLRTI
nr:hypothetical protein [Tanacetum cinerariifolium]